MLLCLDPVVSKGLGVMGTSVLSLVTGDERESTEEESKRTGMIHSGRILTLRVTHSGEESVVWSGGVHTCFGRTARQGSLEGFSENSSRILH